MSGGREVYAESSGVFVMSLEVSIFSRDLLQGFLQICHLQFTKSKLESFWLGWWYGIFGINYAFIYWTSMSFQRYYSS